MDMNEISGLDIELKLLLAKVEAILFTMGEAVEIRRIAEAVGHDEDTVRNCIRALSDRYKDERVYYDTHYFDEKIDNGHNGEELRRVFGLEWTKMPKVLKALLYSKRIIFKAARKLLKILRLQNYYFDGSYCYNSEIFNLRGNYIIFQAWTSLKYFEPIKNRFSEIFKFPDFSSDDKKNLEIKK